MSDSIRRHAVRQEPNPFKIIVSDFFLTTEKSRVD